jgi:O-antigen ligase/tetratricopeptide (TPR) repeat protein
VLIPIVFDPAADLAFVVPKTLLSHALTYALIAAIIGMLIIGEAPQFARSWAHAPVLAFFAVNALAAVFAVNTLLALFGTHARMLGLATHVDFLVTYVAAVVLVRRPKELLAVVGSVLAPSLLVLTYEAVQILGRDPISWAVPTTRPFSTIGQSTTLGQYLTILGVIALAIAVFARDAPRALRVGLIGYSAILILGAAMSGTRSAAVGLVAAGFALLILVWTKHPHPRARWLSLVGGVVVTAVFSGVLLVTPLGARLASTIDASPAGMPDNPVGLEESAGARIPMYKMAFDMFRERPLLGYGPDNFSAGVPIYRPEAAPAEIRQSIATSPHSWVAAIAVNAGALGVMTFVTILAIAFLLVLRSPFSPVVATASVGIVAYLASGVTSINALETDTLFWFGLGVIIGSRPMVIPERQDASSHSRRRKRHTDAPSALAYRFSWAIVGVGLLVATTAFSALDASRLAKRSIAMRTSTTAAVAIDLASRATHLDPNRADYWGQLGFAYVAASRWSDASLAFQRAAALAPYDIRFLTDDLQVQLLQAQAGDTGALVRGRALAEKAVRTDSNNPRAHLALAQVVFLSGDLTAAVTSIDRALRLDPNSTNVQLLTTAAQVYVRSSQTYTATGRISDAIDVARRGVTQMGPIVASLPVRVELARALARAGRTAEALDALSFALAIDPNYQDAVRLRSELGGGT